MVKERVKKYKEDIRKREHDRRGDIYEGLQLEEEKERQVN